VTGHKRLRNVTELDVDLTASLESSLVAAASSASGMAALEQQAQLPNWLNADSSAVLSVHPEEAKEYLHKLKLVGGQMPCDEVAHADDRPEARYTAIKMSLQQQPTAKSDGHGEQVLVDRLESIVVHAYSPAVAREVLPNAQRAKKMVDVEVTRVQRQAQAMRGHSESADVSLESLRYLDVHIRQEIRELFEQVVEVLRHFYHNIRHSESMTKAEANIKRLGEIEQKIEVKKQRCAHHHGQGAEELGKEQQFPIWSEMLKMIKRANDNWDRMTDLAQRGV